MGWVLIRDATKRFVGNSGSKKRDQNMGYGNETFQKDKNKDPFIEQGHKLLE